MPMESVWKRVKAAIKTQIPAHCYRMWIEPIDLIGEDDKVLILSCANFFSQKRIQDHYGDIISREIKNATGNAFSFSLQINGKKNDASDPLEADSQMMLPDLNAGAYGGRLLRKNFTFDHFVVGGNNDFAYSAALSMASKRNRHQNALFLLAGTGMGKSHLSQAVGHYIMKQFPTERVYYITAEDFTNEMVAAFRNNSIDKFKEKYRSRCDVLLLEDVQFLSGKERTQTELALTLDALFDSGKKIIFSSCYLPSEIPKLSPTLSSRLSNGLISQIDPPDFRTRTRILKHKAALNGYAIPDEVSQYLAGELTENVRQLESGLISVGARSSLMGIPIDLKLAEYVVKVIGGRKKQITLETIKKVVCKHYGVTREDLVSKSRKQSVVRPRQMAIYLARRYTDQSLQAIGRCFNRYHATALHAIASVERGMKQDGQIRKHVEFLSQKIESGKL